MLIARAASHFEAFLSAFKMSMDRNGFYPRLSSYYEYKMHLLDLIPLKECLITQYKLKSMPPARAFASSHPTYGNGLELVGGSAPKPPAYPLGFIFYYHFVTYK